MPITITCPQCQKKLQVPDAHAGKKVRCAGCKTVIAVPAADEEFASPEPEGEPADTETAVTKTPTKPKPKAWDDEPEKDKDEDDGYGLDEEDERDRKRRKKKQRKRYDDDDDDEDEDDYRGRRPRRSRGEPHRGVTVLVLGILSIVIACGCPLVCWILAAIAVNMGNTDKAKMERGVMDRSGEGMNTAGIACAYIGTLLGIINCIAGAALRSMGKF